MELGHDDLGGRNAFVPMDLRRDAASVVVHRHGAVSIERHIDLVAIAREGFVDGVVDNLIDHVVQARAVIGVADIHARTLADGVEAFQHFDGLGAVIGRGFSLAFGSWCHGLRGGFFEVVSWIFGPPGGGAGERVNHGSIIPRFTAKI